MDEIAKDCTFDQRMGQLQPTNQDQSVQSIESSIS
jgi:hypothetical protein